jgi:amino-acid N-acetyltransferase
LLRTLAIRTIQTSSEDWLTFVSLLNLAELPVPEADEIARFLAVEDEMGLIGFGGLEGSGPDQLLRSVVTASGVRRRGLGKVLVRQLVEEARSQGAERLWLLTSKANSFFAKLGWSEEPRDKAPELVRMSRRYTEICPATAALMVRSVR